MINYTKGKWIVFKNMGMGSELFPKGHHQIVGNGQKSNVALIPTHWENAEANAQLIASAPDLYEALKYVIRQLDQAGIIKANSLFMETPNKALAKAEGE